MSESTEKVKAAKAVTRKKTAKAAEETPARVGRGTVKFGELEFKLDKNINMRILLALDPEGDGTQEVSTREVLQMFVDFVNRHNLLVSSKPRTLTWEEMAEQGDDFELGLMIFEWRERTRPNVRSGALEPAAESLN